MSKEQYNFSAVRSSRQKAEWGHPLVSHHQPHSYFPQQDLHRSQDVCIHPSSMEAANLQLTAAESTIRNLKASIDDCTIQSQAHINVGQIGMPSHHVNMLALQASTKDNHKNSVDIAQRLQQPRSGEERMHPRKGSRKAGGAIFPQSKHTKSSAPKRMCSTFISPLTVRPIGTKDRHSKVRTAKGLRDRRVRLSAPTAIQFFDVQDRLGYDQPSQAVDWLIKKARAAIDELAPIDGVLGGDEIVSGRLLKERKSSRLHDLRAKDDEQVLTEIPGARAESRAKARERARERAKEKTTTPVPPPTNTSADTSTTSSTSTAGPASSHWPFNSSNVQLLPDFFLLSGQFQQQFDELHRPSDQSFICKPPSALPSTSQLIPFSSAFFSTSSTPPSFIIPADTPVQHSTPTTTAHTSPRGTLQSIFSDRPTSSMRAHAPMPSLAMMGDPAQAYSYDAPLSSLVQDQGDHDQHVPFQRSSDVFVSVDSHHHSHIPMRMRGMELGSHVEETRITSSSMQAYYQ